MPLWKINCMERHYPGMWQRWFLSQCVAVGWFSGSGYHLHGETKDERGWIVCRNALKRIKIGDDIVVTLSDHRVGRIGKVVNLAIGDDEWNPLVPKDATLPDGEMGRRILVRWDMLTGPDDREMIVALPESAQLTAGELRPTLAEIRSRSVDELKHVMNDRANWVGIWNHFAYESALSGYIAAYPHRLEDGLLPYPNGKIRERVFADMSRLDVILLDRSGMPVIVECKQGQPTLNDLDQLRGYLKNLAIEAQRNARGILVHGGARKIRREIQLAADLDPKIEIVQYKLDVDFIPSN